MICTSVLLPDRVLRISESWWELTLRLPWFRSLPVSAVRDISVRVGDHSVISEGLTLDVNGTTSLLSALGARSDYWFVQDEAVLRTTEPMRGPRATTVDVEVEMELRIPHLIAPTGPLVVRPSQAAAMIPQWRTPA